MSLDIEKYKIKEESEVYVIFLARDGDNSEVIITEKKEEVLKVITEFRETYDDVWIQKPETQGRTILEGHLTTITILRCKGMVEWIAPRYVID